MDEKHQLSDDPPSHMTEDQEKVRQWSFWFVCFLIKVALLKVEIDIEILKKKVIYLNFSIFP